MEGGVGLRGQPERGYPRDKEGRDASTRLYRDLPVLRSELEDEYRAILYPPPWYETPLRFLGRIPTENRKPDDATNQQDDTN